MGDLERMKQDHEKSQARGEELSSLLVKAPHTKFFLDSI